MNTKMRFMILGILVLGLLGLPGCDSLREGQVRSRTLNMKPDSCAITQAGSMCLDGSTRLVRMNNQNDFLPSLDGNEALLVVHPYYYPNKKKPLKEKPVPVVLCHEKIIGEKPNGKVKVREDCTRKMLWEKDIPDKYQPLPAQARK